MKELTLDEISLLEEMKSNCLKKGQYIDDKAKDKFKMLCHLEDFSISYYELLDVIKEVREYIMSELITEWNIKNGGHVSGSDLPVEAITPILEILDKVGDEK